MYSYNFFFLYVAYLKLNYTLLAYTAGCLFYNATLDDFDSAGCRVGTCSSPLAVQCICSHLTSFSNAFKAPTLRYDTKAFELKNLNQNPVAFAFCIACVLAYLVLWLFCRRKDLDDLKLVFAYAQFISSPFILILIYREI